MCKLKKEIEQGKIIDWIKFGRLKRFRGPLSPVGLVDVMALEKIFKRLYYNYED